MKELDSLDFRIEKVILIAEHRGERECVCKRCGCVNDVAALYFTAKGKNIRSDCPDCGSFIKMMRQSVKTMLFDFNEKKTAPIDELPNNLLLWYLRKGRLNAEKRADVEMEVEKRKKAV